MKRINILLVLMLAVTTLFAQVPRRFTYQAVVRDASGTLIANGNVGLRLTLLQGSATGTAVWTSSQTVTTNANGLFTVEVGAGAASLDDVDWSQGPYFLKSEVDPTGGNNYTVSTVHQLLSVPYAMHASTVENHTLADAASQGNAVQSQIKQLSDPTEDMDAVNLRTLNAALALMQQRIDSLIARINCSTTSGVEDVIACDSYTWLLNGETYTATTTDTLTLVGANTAGCDSVVILHLTVNHGTYHAESHATGSSYDWHGTTYTATGAYTYSYTNEAGCLSVDTLHLTITPPPTSGVWIDLGLPSGLLWASSNLGAISPEDYGDYYAWGETSTKSNYDWTTYAYHFGYDSPRECDSCCVLTKYCDISYYGYNGFADNLTILEAMDDAATANMGNGARIPTREEWQELLNHTTSIWTTHNGVYGRMFTASNGNSIFLPAAGGCSSGLFGAGSYGYYWSSSLNTGRPCFALLFHFYPYSQDVWDNPRNDGQSVRAVRQN